MVAGDIVGGKVEFKNKETMKMTDNRHKEKHKDDRDKTTMLFNSYLDSFLVFVGCFVGWCLAYNSTGMCLFGVEV